MTYGTFPACPSLTWPMCEPSASLDYVLVVDGSVSTAERLATVADCTDTITAAALAISPAGELAAANLTVSGGTITVWLSGGVAGRQYTVAITAATATRTYQWIVGIVCDPLLATWPLVAATPGFGTPITWGNSSDALLLTAIL